MYGAREIKQGKLDNQSFNSLLRNHYIKKMKNEKDIDEKLLMHWTTPEIAEGPGYF